MFIKILYLVFIFLIVRFVIRTLSRVNELESLRKSSSKKNEDDIVDAEFTVLNDKE